jgi:redox-sensitive bicupin YhaK (pirin superfamily)
MRKIVEIHRAGPPHWVGDGFPVRSVFTYDGLGEALSPFLLLDHAGPAQFSPTDRARGVGEHPHRGFETVTIVYEGEVEHRDSAGNGGRIGPGDVQWMTAASGILHEEYHSRDFARTGGTFEVAQLWVNLPARSKMAPPEYQTLLNQDIPAVTLPDNAGVLRVIAGEFNGRKGPAAPSRRSTCGICACPREPMSVCRCRTDTAWRWSCCKAKSASTIQKRPMRTRWRYSSAVTAESPSTRTARQKYYC